MIDNSVRTLFLLKHSPYPPMGGAPLRNWQNIKAMMQLGEVAVFSVSSYKSPRSREYPPGVSLWKDYSTGDILKERSLIRKISDRLWWMRLYGYPEADQFYGDRVAQELQRLLVEFAPNIVVFEEIWLYRYLKIIKPYGCCLIYDAHNIEKSLRRDISVSEHKPPFVSSLSGIKTAIIEGYLVQQVDQIWVCSQQEAHLLQKLYRQIPPTHIVANGVNIADYHSDRISHSLPTDGLEPNHFTAIFTATFSYYPNSVAAQILIGQIYPQLRKFYPNCRLILAGHSPTPYMKESAQEDSGIIVTGKASDIRPYLTAASVVIVPLLKGGGTRLKILEAFAAHRPVVSTTKGAEGLNVRDGEHLLIRDKVEDIVAGVCQLWSDSSLGRKLAESAYKLVQQEYSSTAVRQQVEQAVLQLLPSDFRF
ncbi:MAG TPA: glycosyl transferase family 1 [Cyanobacteria bacterium UBA8803]|nr:glycosyl transferase family 1 [Cyanobacteria bacterium UBA9273]HBL57554.1 glycosyl transferase family 1 [Cyanobacteria bacterium UBA8803]